MIRVFISLASNVHQSWRSVDQPNFITTLGQPERVHSGSAADIEHARGRLGRVPENQLTGSNFLELKRTVLQPRFFGRVVVVVLDLGVEARLICHVLLVTK